MRRKKKKRWNRGENIKEKKGRMCRKKKKRKDDKEEKRSKERGEEMDAGEEARKMEQIGIMEEEEAT